MSGAKGKFLSVGFTMKRLSLLIASFVLLAASIGWAVTNCQQFGPHAAHHQDTEMAIDKVDPAHDHHSKSDAPTVHCPNQFGDFILSAPVLPNYKRVEFRVAGSIATLAVSQTAQFSRYLSFHSPPRILGFSVPDYLLFSVLRI
jgi:hypothetical protein